MIQHTPAPWEVVPGDSSDPTITVEQRGPHWQGPVVAEVWPTPSEDGINDTGVAMANARVIAAAPTMLDALRDVFEYINDGMDPDDPPVHYDIVASAIERATGTRPV